MTSSDIAGDMPLRSIDLTPEDWRWVTYREHTPLAGPEPRPFSIDEATARLAKVRTRTYGWDWDWSTAKIAISLSQEEALFWLEAMTSLNHDDIKSTPTDSRKRLPQELATRLKSQFSERTSGAAARSSGGLIARIRGATRPKATHTSASSPGIDDVRERLTRVGRLAGAEIILPLYNLVSLEDIVDLVLDADRSVSQQPQWQQSNLSDKLAIGFRTCLLPYLTDSETEMVRQRLHPTLDPKLWPANFHSAPPASYRIAACLGMHEHVLALVKSWPDALYVGEVWLDHYHRPQEIVFGLGSAQLVESEMRRLKLRLNNPTYIRAWLAHAQYAALDVVRDSVLAIANKQDAERLLKAFSIVHAPEAAAPMLALMLSSKAPQVAREWLHENPEHAIVGLVPAVAESGKLAEAAIEFLIGMKRKGYETQIRTCLEHAPAEMAGKVRSRVLDTEEDACPPFDETTTPKWLTKALPDKKTLQKTPAWVDAVLLPPIVVGEHRLNNVQVAGLLAVLRQSKLDQPPHSLIAGLKEHADPGALDAFAWELFQLWQRHGAPSKEKWILFAVGLLGNDNSVLKLAPLIRKWPGESQHQRAVLGLACLRAIGTDTALMQINGIAQKVKFKGLKARAREAMEAIAEARKMTREQLEDRIVPDCGLDERGGRVFDFGPRQFRFVLGPEMKPMLRDQDGKLKANLPRPGVRDNADLASQAVADWKLLKKQIREVAKIQAVRLEQAMVTGRRWSPEEFEELLVRHPLMVNLARMLLWGGYDRSGRLECTFRVTEDQTYADVEDEEVALTGIAEIGILHPLHLSDDLKSAWGELLSDYELVPPFPQLGREVYRLLETELGETEITRFADDKVPAVSLVGTLDRQGWTRGIPEDAGMFYEHSKPFHGANVTAIAQYYGVPIGYMQGWEDQSIERCFFVPGIYRPEMYRRHENKVPLGKVDPVVISEVLRDLMMIASKSA
jgi:hypothetical protein